MVSESRLVAEENVWTQDGESKKRLKKLYDETRNSYLSQLIHLYE